MKDQATVAFRDADGYEYARIYLPHGGHAAGIKLKQFFAAERERNRLAVNFYHLRFSFPMFLAARFVAYANTENGQGVGIVPQAYTEAINVVVTCPRRENEDPEVRET